MMRIILTFFLVLTGSCSNLPGMGVIETAGGIGLVRAVAGAPLVLRDGGNFLVEPGVVIKSADSVVARDAAAIRVAMQDGSSVSVAENSEFVFHEYLWSRAEAVARMSLGRGVVRIELDKFGDRGDTGFEITTPHAKIRLGAGELWIRNSLEQLEVVLLKGGVCEVVSPLGARDFSKRGQGVTFRLGKKPGVVEAWSEQQMTAISRATTIEGPYD